jgi:hypothetical protein
VHNRRKYAPLFTQTFIICMRIPEPAVHIHFKPAQLQYDKKNADSRYYRIEQQFGGKV